MLATFAEDLVRFGAPIAAGTGIGAFAGFLAGAFAQLWIGRVVPIERWMMWAGGIGGIFGLVALAYGG
jgi:hypothetical protein